VLHDEGSVGCCHSESPDTEACKFYITLCKAPVMDGEFTIFGKVIRGLDVAHKIFTQPVRNDPSFPEGDRPEKPIVIRKVTIQTQEVESVAAN
jgi:cyclophilin family peptidyl-prolyl cis-trans isomerase